MFNFTFWKGNKPTKFQLVKKHSDEITNLYYKVKNECDQRINRMLEIDRLIETQDLTAKEVLDLHEERMRISENGFIAFNILRYNTNFLSLEAKLNKLRFFIFGNNIYMSVENIYKKLGCHEDTWMNAKDIRDSMSPTYSGIYGILSGAKEFPLVVRFNKNKKGE